MAKDKDPSSRESSIASGWTVEGAEPAGEAATAAALGAGERDPRPDTDALVPAQQISSIALVLLGLIGGIYLFYTVVWFSWAQHYSSVNALVADGSGALGGVLQQIVFWAAPLAPVLWFCSVLVLCRGARAGKIALWLLIGALVLVPLPMFQGVLF